VVNLLPGKATLETVLSLSEALVKGVNSSKRGDKLACWMSSLLEGRKEEPQLLLPHVLGKNWVSACWREGGIVPFGGEKKETSRAKKSPSPKKETGRQSSNVSAPVNKKKNASLDFLHAKMGGDYKGINLFEGKLAPRGRTSLPFISLEMKEGRYTSNYRPLFTGGLFSRVNASLPSGEGGNGKAIKLLRRAK